jgi:hypothetical protein
MRAHSRAAMAHGMLQSASRPLIDVVDAKDLFQLGQQDLRRGPAGL